jgi:hypothetical protein
MIDVYDTTGRILARSVGRALPTRATSSIGPDPNPVFGIAPIKVVSEDIIQAVAFGRLDAAPQVAVRWNPLSRDTSALEPFARALDEYLTAASVGNRLGRVWVPNGTALTLIELLGYRYRTNQQASPALRRLGAQAIVLAGEARYAGQQVVVVATELLRSHVTTGQQPIKDNHLNALLAWVRPVPGVDPAVEADRRALVPAAAMLERDVDDHVEFLRKVGKGRGRAADEARGEIEHLLGRGALREWGLLSEARSAFWGLGLHAAPGVDALVRTSIERVGYALTTDRNRPSNPDTIARLLDAHEFATQRLDDVDTRGDGSARERARRQGRVIRARVVSITQPLPNRHPCTILVETDQPVVRVRRDANLSTWDGRIAGSVVREWHERPGWRRFEIVLSHGVRATELSRLPAEGDWYEASPFDTSFIRGQAYRAMRTANPALAYGDALPLAIPRSLPPGELLDIADGLRRP